MFELAFLRRKSYWQNTYPFPPLSPNCDCEGPPGPPSSCCCCLFALLLLLLLLVVWVGRSTLTLTLLLSFLMTSLSLLVLLACAVLTQSFGGFGVVLRLGLGRRGLKKVRAWYIF